MSAAPPEDTSQEQLEEIVTELRSLRAGQQRLFEGVQIVKIWVRVIGFIIIAWLVISAFVQFKTDADRHFSGASGSVSHVVTEA